MHRFCAMPGSNAQPSEGVLHAPHICWLLVGVCPICCFPDCFSWVHFALQALLKEVGCPRDMGWLLGMVEPPKVASVIGWVFLCLRVCEHRSVCMRADTCLHVCTHVCMLVHQCVCMHVHANVHACEHLPAHVHTCMYMHVYGELQSVLWTLPYI